MKLISKHKNNHVAHNHPRDKMRLNGIQISDKGSKKSLFVSANKVNVIPKISKAILSIGYDFMSLVVKIFSGAINLAIMIAIGSVIPTLWGWYVIPNSLVGNSGENINVALRFISSNGVSLQYPNEGGVASVEYEGVKDARAPEDSIYVSENLKNVYEFSGESFTIPFGRFSQAEPLDLGCMKRLPDARLNRDDSLDGIKAFYLYSVTCDLTYNSVFSKIFAENKYAKSVSSLAIHGNDIFVNQESFTSRIFNVREAKGAFKELAQHDDVTSISNAIWQGTLSKAATFAPWPVFGLESLFHLATFNKYGHNHYLQGLIGAKHVLHKGDKVFIKHGSHKLRFIFIQGNPD